MPDADKTIAVNGEAVSPDLCLQELDALRRRYAEQGLPIEDPASLAQDAEENAIEHVLLVQQARRLYPELPAEDLGKRFSEICEQCGGEESLRQHLGDEPEAEARLRENLGDGLRLERYLAMLCQDVPAPADEELRAYYDTHPDEFTQPEMVRVAHILQRPGPQRDPPAVYCELLTAREEVLRTGDFAAVARRYSQCNDQGGDLGWFARGQMVESFEEAVFALAPGQVSDVFQTEYGYHLAKMIERRPSVPRTFEAVRVEIHDRLWEERKNLAIGAVVDGLREHAEIVRS